MSGKEVDDFSAEELGRLIAEDIEWQQQWKKELYEAMYGEDYPWTIKG